MKRGKVQLDLLMMRCLGEVARAMEQGNRLPGRGAFNWRGKPVRESDMVAGALRHILKSQTGERRDRHSGQRHLAHAVARLLIAMDAEDHGKLLGRKSQGRK